MDHITLSPNLESYYQKGLAAIEKNNFDYAIELLMQVVQEEPMHAPSRKFLRFAERARLEESPHPKLAVLFLKINSLLPLILGLVYEASKQPVKALAFYEESLKNFPNDTSILIKIVTISLKQNWLDVAIGGYEDLLEVDGKNLEYLKKAGYLYKQKCDVEKAKSYFNRALQLYPNEQDIKKDLKDLDALTTIQDGNWDDKGSFRSKIKDLDFAHQSATDVPRTTSEQASVDEQEIIRLERVLADSPDDANTLFALALALKTNNQLDKSLATITTLTEQYPDNIKYHETFADIAELNHIKIANDLNKKLSFDPHNATLKAALATLQKQKLHDTIKILKKKIEMYPNDLNLRYELGTWLHENGDYNDAISQFQLSVKDPSRLTASLNQLGLCFMAKKMFDLAVVQFRKALERESSINDTTKEIIYNLGSTYELMGKTDEALTEYKKIYEVDISYLDVAQKIDQHYKQ